MIKHNEFDLIAEVFAPLSDKKHGRGLLDDGAVMLPSPGKEIVATTDMLVAGVHFMQDALPGDIARKALRVNLSDLAAMGAIPRYYMMALALPQQLDDNWLRVFTKGLEEDQNAYSVTLIGGDTVATPGPLSITITCFGEVPIGLAIGRNRATPGDFIFVTGSIGDASFGLAILSGKLDCFDDSKALVDRYRLPQPRCNIGHQLINIAHAAIDISDGLLADLRHICRASGVHAVVDASSIPLAKPVAKFIEKNTNFFERAISGGDDYEILFTADPRYESLIARLAGEVNLPITKIGAIQEGQGISLQAEDGRSITVGFEGYTHR